MTGAPEHGRAVAAVTVTVDDDHLHRIDQVATELRDNGMQVDQVLGDIGIITGSAPDDRRRALAAIDGVTSIEAATRFRLPPPDAPIQ